MGIEAPSGDQAVSEEEARAEHRRSMLPSPGEDAQSPGEVVELELHRSNRRLDEEEVDIPLRSGEGQEEAAAGGKKLVPSFPLVGLLVLFFFLYVGIEVGFGAWIAVVVLRDELAGEAGAALMARYLSLSLSLSLPLSLAFSPLAGIRRMDGKGASKSRRGGDGAEDSVSRCLFINLFPAFLPTGRAAVECVGNTSERCRSSSGFAVSALPSGRWPRVALRPLLASVVASFRPK